MYILTRALLIDTDRKGRRILGCSIIYVTRRRKNIMAMLKGMANSRKWEGWTLKRGRKFPNGTITIEYQWQKEFPPPDSYLHVTYTLTRV